MFAVTLTICLPGGRKQKREQHATNVHSNTHLQRQQGVWHARIC